MTLGQLVNPWVLLQHLFRKRSLWITGMGLFTGRISFSHPTTSVVITWKMANKMEEQQPDKSSE